MWVALAGLCAAVVLSVVWPAGRPEGEVMFVSPEKVFEEPNRLQRWMARFRGWGAPQALIQTETFSSERLGTGEKVAELLGRKADAEKDGTKVWILDYEEFERAMKEFSLTRNKVIARQNVATKRGQRATSFTGLALSRGDPMMQLSQNVGRTLVTVASGTEEQTDLIVGMLATEEAGLMGGRTVVKTNAQVAARVQISPKARVLLVTESGDVAPIWTLISVKWR